MPYHNVRWVNGGPTTYLCHQGPPSNSLISWARLEALMQLDQIEAIALPAVRTAFFEMQRLIVSQMLKAEQIVLDCE